MISSGQHLALPWPGPLRRALAVGAAIGVMAIAALATLVMASNVLAIPTFSKTSIFADAADKVQVMRGKAVYSRNCASCHGHSLQGQPLWQMPVTSESPRRAPALNPTGPAWQRSDRELLVMTRSGAFPGAQPAVPTTMPAFAAILGDTDIVAVVAFIKARWPIGLRVLQATRNPGAAGMPIDARGTDWRLPPECLHPVPVREGEPSP